MLLLASVLVIAAQEPQESSPKPQAPPEPAANPVKQEPPPAPVVEAPKLPDELSVFNAAVISYNDNLFERAEKEFKDFQVNYPTSTNLSQAIVYQGLSLYRQEKYTETRGFFSSLLTQTNAATLPVNKDQYHYWIGMASLKLADYPGAITSFSELLKEHSNSSLVPNALYYTGDAWKMLGNTKRAIELFDAEGSLFLTVAEKEPNNIYVIQGRLLLAELFLSQNELDKARGILEKVATSNLPPELQWKRLFLLARVNLAQKDSAAATLNINSLLTLTTNAGLLSLEYQGLALQGDLLRQENKIEEAAAIYERNVANKLIPLSDRWQALMNTVRIKLELGKRDDAIRLLKSFNEESGNKPYSDELLATLGNLQMQDYYQAIPQLGVLEPGRGLKNEKILAAYANYTNLVTAFPKSTFLPKAQLNLGLCHWELSRPLDAMVCYSNAIASLPISEDNAFARIKLAEAQFYQKDFAAVALT
jgi:TolA-binding protein